MTRRLLGSGRRTSSTFGGMAPAVDTRDTTHRMPWQCGPSVSGHGNRKVVTCLYSSTMTRKAPLRLTLLSLGRCCKPAVVPLPELPLKGGVESSTTRRRVLSLDQPRSSGVDLVRECFYTTPTIRSPSSKVFSKTCIRRLSLPQLSTRPGQESAESRR